jgi:Flp pilus assembly protein TadG
MRTIASFIGLSRQLARFAHDRRGVSAVEFAMLLPLMITLYLGTVEISQGVAINRKVTLTTRTVADLASQVSSINNADMTNILKATAAVVAPYDASKLKVVVSAVTIGADSVAKVTWSDTLNGTKYEPGTVITTIKPALKVPNTTLIWSEVTYLYKPTIGYMISGTLTLADQIFMRPRLSDTVTRLP